MATRRRKKARRKTGRKKARKSAKRRVVRRSGGRKKRSGKGKIPLKILERRTAKMIRLVKSRGGRVY